MIDRFLTRWQRKGTGRRTLELVVMACVGTATVIICDALGYDDHRSEAILAVVTAYVSKLFLPTEN